MFEKDWFPALASLGRNDDGVKIAIDAEFPSDFGRRDFS